MKLYCKYCREFRKPEYIYSAWRCSYCSIYFTIEDGYIPVGTTSLQALMKSINAEYEEWK